MAYRKCPIKMRDGPLPNQVPASCQTSLHPGCRFCRHLCGDGNSPPARILAEGHFVTVIRQS
eukprot:scaffold67648_cov17-Tisochrysis_lutea.AAC.5